MKRGQPRRFWGDAEAKRGACRVCAAWPAELAHVAGRRYDKPRTPGSKTLYVHPDSVVPLCGSCHDRYDGRAQPRLDLLGHLTVQEEVRVVLDLGGLELARVRLAPSLYGRSTGGARAA